MTRLLWHWGPVVLHMAAIFWMSSLPPSDLPSHVPDKLAHAGIYAVLAVLVTRALAGGLPARVDWRTAAAAVALVTAYGISDEIHQAFVPGRVADPFDVYADALGAAIGVGLCRAWGIMRIARHP